MKVVFFGEELCERAPEYMGIFLCDQEAKWVSLGDIIAAMRQGEEIHIRPASESEMQRAESAVILHDIGRQLGYAVMNLLDQEEPKVGITAVTQLREALESAPLDEAAAIPTCSLDKSKGGVMGIFDAFFGADDARKDKPPAKLGGIDPATFGLLSAAAAALEAGGPSRIPVSTGQALGRMFTSGLQGYQSAFDAQQKREDRQMMRDYRKAQIADLSRKSRSAEDLDSFFKSRLYGTPGIMPAADMSASVDALGQGAAVSRFSS